MSISPRIVAEIACSHRTDPRREKELIDSAFHRCRSDCVNRRELNRELMATMHRVPEPVARSPRA